MSHTVSIDEFEFEIEISSVTNVAPNSSSWDSDWDYYGYREMEFEVLGAVEYDEDGDSVELSKERCAELAERFADTIEEKLWDQLADEADDYDDSREHGWEAA